MDLANIPFGLSRLIMPLHHCFIDLSFIVPEIRQTHFIWTIVHNYEQMESENFMAKIVF